MDMRRVQAELYKVLCTSSKNDVESPYVEMMFLALYFFSKLQF